jgi:hypothetical protein
MEGKGEGKKVRLGEKRRREEFIHKGEATGSEQI